MIFFHFLGSTDRSPMTLQARSVSRTFSALPARHVFEESLNRSSSNEVQSDVAESCSSSQKGSMMTPRLSASLSKAGYGLVGNHSAVKICRWTKKQLQGDNGVVLNLGDGFDVQHNFPFRSGRVLQTYILWH